MFRPTSLIIALFFAIIPFAVMSAENTTDKPLLIVSNTSGSQEPISFDLAALKALDQTTFVTTTLWTEGPQTFTGVSLATLLANLGISEGTAFASAINDYTVEIPVSDAVEGGPIIAYELNGEEMSIRDKGPLWVVYPYDSNADYRAEVIYSRSIWQLDRIRFEQ